MSLPEGRSRPNGTVEKITGAPAGTFRSFAHKNAEVWRETV
jgi:hypothetical protein